MSQRNPLPHAFEEECDGRGRGGGDRKGRRDRSIETVPPPLNNGDHFGASVQESHKQPPSPPFPLLSLVTLVRTSAPINPAAFSRANRWFICHRISCGLLRGTAAPSPALTPSCCCAQCSTRPRSASTSVCACDECICVCVCVCVCGYWNGRCLFQAPCR